MVIGGRDGCDGGSRRDLQPQQRERNKSPLIYSFFLCFRGAAALNEFLALFPVHILSLSLFFSSRQYQVLTSSHELNQSYTLCSTAFCDPFPPS